MIESKFQVGEEVYVVQDYKIVKVTIEEVVLRRNKEKENLEYIVLPIAVNNEKVTTRAFPEAYLVKDFETAKKSALANWEAIIINVRKALGNLKEEDFNAKTE